MALNRDGDRRSTNSAPFRSSGSKPKEKRETIPSFATPEGRISFHHIFEPEENDSGVEKYDVTLLFPPDANLDRIWDALHLAAEGLFGSKKDWPKGMRKPSDVVRDCEEKDQYAGYLPGWKFVKFSTQMKPGVVDKNKDDVFDKTEVYNGRWARVSCSAYAYDNKSKGVAMSLNHIQLLTHAESFSGRSSAQDEFDDTYRGKDVGSRDDGGDDRGGGRRGDDRDDSERWDKRDNRGRGDDRDDRDSSRDRDADRRGGRDDERDDGRAGRRAAHDEDRSSRDERPEPPPRRSSREDDDERGSDRYRGNGRDRDSERGRDRDRDRDDSRDTRASEDRGSSARKRDDDERGRPADRERGSSRTENRPPPGRASRDRDADANDRWN